MSHNRGRTFVIEDEKDDYVLLQELLDKGKQFGFKSSGSLPNHPKVTSEREGSPASQLNPDGTRTRFRKRENVDEEPGGLSPSPLSIRKRAEDHGNIQSIADFLNESRLSPGEVEALRADSEFGKITHGSASKENIRPGHESRIGSIRRKVSSVISNYTTTPPRSGISSANAPFASETPTKALNKKYGPIDMDDLNQRFYPKDRTLSTASTLKVEIPPGSSNNRDGFFGIPYEATNPLQPDPTTDQSSCSVRRKPVLSLNTSSISRLSAANAAETIMVTDGSVGATHSNSLDDPFSVQSSKSPARTHPLIKASNSWASEMFAVSEAPSPSFVLSTPPSIRSSYRNSDESIIAVTKDFAQKAQALTAENGREEIFDHDHPTVRNLERALKARVYSSDSPPDSDAPSGASSAIAPLAKSSSLGAKNGQALQSGVTSANLEGEKELSASCLSSRNSKFSMEKLSTSTTASDTSNHTSFLLVEPADGSGVVPPASTKAKDSYDICCQGFQESESSSTIFEDRTLIEVFDPHYELRPTPRQFPFLKRPRGQASTETVRGKSLNERIAELRKRTGTEIVDYQPTDERCCHPNHNRTWYSKK